MHQDAIPILAYLHATCPILQLLIQRFAKLIYTDILAFCGISTRKKNIGYLPHSYSYTAEIERHIHHLSSKIQLSDLHFSLKSTLILLHIFKHGTLTIPADLHALLYYYPKKMRTNKAMKRSTTINRSV